MNTTAEAIATTPDYDFDPAMVEKKRIRMRFVKPAEEGQEPEVIHDRTYVPADRRRSLTNKAQQLEDRLQGLDEEDADQAISVLADMVELLLEDAKGLADTIRYAWSLDAVSVEHMARTTGWIQREQNARVTAGEA